MKNQKGSGIAGILIAIMLALIAVGGSAYYFILGSYPLRKEHMTEMKVLEIAKEVAQTHDIDLAEYQMPSIEYDSENKEWFVSYVIKPPTPPGGHFSIIVDDTTGEAKFQGGM